MFVAVDLEPALVARLIAVEDITYVAVDLSTHVCCLSESMKIKPRNA
jgi:hypothetical protein